MPILIHLKVPGISLICSQAIDDKAVASLMDKPKRVVRIKAANGKAYMTRGENIATIAEITPEEEKYALDRARVEAETRRSQERAVQAEKQAQAAEAEKRARKAQAAAERPEPRLVVVGGGKV